MWRLSLNRRLKFRTQYVLLWNPIFVIFTLWYPCVCWYISRRGSCHILLHFQSNLMPIYYLWHPSAPVVLDKPSLNFYITCPRIPTARWIIQSSSDKWNVVFSLIEFVSENAIYNSNIWLQFKAVLTRKIKTPSDETISTSAVCASVVLQRKVMSGPV